VPIIDKKSVPFIIRDSFSEHLEEENEGFTGLPVKGPSNVVYQAKVFYSVFPISY